MPETIYLENEIKQAVLLFCILTAAGKFEGQDSFAHKQCWYLQMQNLLIKSNIKLSGKTGIDFKNVIVQVFLNSGEFFRKFSFRFLYYRFLCKQQQQQHLI